MGAVTVSIRPAAEDDGPRILALADRLAAFGPTTRGAVEIADRERRALAEALARPQPGSALVVAVESRLGVVGVVLLERRRDYFTSEAHGHVAILAVAPEAEGRGVGRALLDAVEEWGRAQRFRRLTLTVFVENQRAKALYARLGWRAELETHYKLLS